MYNTYIGKLGRYSFNYNNKSIYNTISSSYLFSNFNNSSQYYYYYYYYYFTTQSTTTSSSNNNTNNVVVEEESSSSSSHRRKYHHHQNDDLRSRLMGLVFPRRSATVALEKWVEAGNSVSGSELRRISKLLFKFKRFKHALEVLTWMGADDKFVVTAADHAIILDLIIKERTVAEAENYFEKIPNTISKKSAYFPLLHFYVKERATEKAEDLMLKMNEIGPCVSPHPLNEMMKLYVANSKFEKVLSVIHHMKQNMIPRNVLSYNLWMTACVEVSGVSSAEIVYKEMINDRNVEVGWSSLATLANIYLKSGLIEKANLTLKIAEKRLSTSNRFGYSFLITLYTSANNKDGVLRIWEASKEVNGRISCSNYISILLSLIKLGDIHKAEKIFIEWESQCRNYDIRVSNVLLGAYMRSGLIKKAESLHLHTLERGGCPNYKTWEILMEGWVKNQDMDKAINAMKKGFAKLKHCDWRPPSSIVAAIAEHFENSGNYEEAKRYFDVIRTLGLSSLAVYKSFIRMHARNQRPIQDILIMLQKDDIDLDDETSALIQSFEV